MTETFKEKLKRLEKDRTNGKAETYCRTIFNFSETYRQKSNCFVEDTDTGRYYYPLWDSEQSKESQEERDRRLGRAIVRLPSVTTVLGSTKPKSVKADLEQWSKNVDPDGVLLKKAGARGSILHEHCENYILGKIEKLDINNIHFQQLYPILKSRIGTVYALEAPLYSLVHKIAGRVDLIAEFDCQLSVLDFKTSTRVKEEFEIEDYYIQKTIYSIMFEEMTGIRITKLVTLIARDNVLLETIGSVKPQIIVTNADDYRQKAIERINQFYLGV